MGPLTWRSGREDGSPRWEKKDLKDNEKLHQLSPELFLALGSKQNKAGGGEKKETTQQALVWSCIGSRSVNWLKCRLLLPANV